MKVSSVVLAGFVVLTVALASKTYQLGQELTEGLTAASLEVNEAEEIRRGLLDRIHVLKTPPFSLAGTEATLGQEVTYDAVDSMVLYLFGTSCPLSPQNVPFLNRLHAEGVRVVGIAFDEPKPAIGMFARISGSTFPLLAYPMGDVVDILPRGPVPLTAVFLDGRLDTLWLGPLEEDRRQLLAERFGVNLEEA